MRVFIYGSVYILRSDVEEKKKKGERDHSGSAVSLLPGPVVLKQS